MSKRKVREALERKREEMRRKGKPDRVGDPYDTSRSSVEAGKRQREGSNLDLGEERSAQQKREMEEWRRQASGKKQEEGERH